VHHVVSFGELASNINSSTATEMALLRDLVHCIGLASFDTCTFQLHSEGGSTFSCRYHCGYSSLFFC